MSSRTYANVIGDNLRRLRQQQGLRQDDLAALARSNGLNWSQATVAAIEIERRALAADEEILLQATLGVPNLHQELRATEGLAEDDEIVIGDGFVLTVTEWRGLVRGQPIAPGHAVMRAMWPEEYGGDRRAQAAYRRQQDRLVKRYSVPDSAIPRIVGAAQNQAEILAAQRLKRDPHEIAFAAFNLWGRSLTEERDHREQEQPGEGEARARRGHVTRLLDRELQERVREANRRKGKKR